MKEPQKSKTCGHAYSKEGILSHIQTSRRNNTACVCPCAGCNSEVREEDLEPDAGLERVVKRMKRREEAAEEQRKQSQAMDMDDDEDE